MSVPSGFDPEMKDYLSRASDQVVRCRLYGHAWDPVHDGFLVEGRGREKVYTQHVRCIRCDTSGTDRFDPVTLDRISSRTYDYVDGYLTTNGGLSRRDVRQWVAAKTTSRQRLRRVS